MAMTSPDGKSSLTDCPFKGRWCPLSNTSPAKKLLPQGSGRTDAGVHALAQIATVTTNSPIPVDNLIRALNDILPRSIRVLAAEEMPPDFHARRSAVAKTYRYHIYRGAICSPFQARYVYHHPYPLSESRMIQAAALVEGEHDFTSFAAVDPEKRKEALALKKEILETKAGFKTDAGFETNTGLELNSATSLPNEAPLEPNNVRTIFHSQWQRHGDELIYTVRGNGFLHHMVRNLVGHFSWSAKAASPSQTSDAFLNCVTAPPPQPPPPPADCFWSAWSTETDRVIRNIR